MSLDLEQHLLRQMAWSRATFGPGARQAGVIDHIKKELNEVVEDNEYAAAEWNDVLILALDGFWRDLVFNRHMTHKQAAEQIVEMFQAKQSTNEIRTWPDWRTADPDRAIEHDRSQD